MEKNEYNVAKNFAEMRRFFWYDEDCLGEAFSIINQDLWIERQQIVRMVQDLIKHDFQLPFPEHFYGKQVKALRNPVGARMVRVLGVVARAIAKSEANPLYQFHVTCPEVDLIEKTLKAALTGGGSVAGMGYVAALPFEVSDFEMLGGDSLKVAHKAMNDLASLMRQRFLSKEMRESIKSFRRNATERYKQLMRVAVSGWSRNCKNLLIRLDWGYRKNYPSFPVELKTQDEFYRKCLEVSNYRERMLGVLRNMFGDDLTFYAWKIECGDVKGLHIHWLLAINGSKHQDRINVPRRIADAWDDEIGRDMGKTYNVNALNLAEENGLRVWDYREPGLLSFLGIYCDYLTKVDYTLKLRMPERMRSFGCSKLPKVKKNKPGPARSHQMQMREFRDVRGPQGSRSFNPLRSHHV